MSSIKHMVIFTFEQFEVFRLQISRFMMPTIIIRYTLSMSRSVGIKRSVVFRRLIWYRYDHLKQ